MLFGEWRLAPAGCCLHRDASGPAGHATFSGHQQAREASAQAKTVRFLVGSVCFIRRATWQLSWQARVLCFPSVCWFFSGPSHCETKVSTGEFPVFRTVWCAMPKCHHVPRRDAHCISALRTMQYETRKVAWFFFPIRNGQAQRKINKRPGNKEPALARIITTLHMQQHTPNPPRNALFRPARWLSGPAGGH